jgi:hypothetical protein
MSAGELTMLLFNTYLLFLVLALATWLITIVVEMRRSAPSAEAEERAVTE